MEKTLCFKEKSLPEIGSKPNPGKKSVGKSSTKYMNSPYIFTGLGDLVAMSFTFDKAKEQGVSVMRKRPLRRLFPSPETGNKSGMNMKSDFGRPPCRIMMQTP